MKIENKKDLVSTCSFTATWLVLAIIFLFLKQYFIGLVFLCSTFITGYYTISYYLKNRKTEKEEILIEETVDIQSK